MAKNSNMYIRIDSELKEEVQAIYSKYGMSLTDAINIFLHQSKNVGGLPFDLRPDIPNTETIAAMKEADAISRNPKAKGFKNFDELIKELNS